MEDTDVPPEQQRRIISNQSTSNNEAHHLTEFAQCFSISSSYQSESSVLTNLGFKGTSSSSCDSSKSNAEEEEEDEDELPAFRIRSIAPLSRSPSPIDIVSLVNSVEIAMETTTTTTVYKQQQQELNTDNIDEDYVSLQDMDALISPPKESEIFDNTKDKTANLETIYEGIYLHTPPRQRKCISIVHSSHKSSLSKSKTICKGSADSDIVLHLSKSVTRCCNLSNLENCKNNNNQGSS